jgi:hypothetical protein
MNFIETSAKDSLNVEKIFIDIAQVLTKQANDLYPKAGGQGGGGTRLSEKNLQTNKIGSCCT